MIALIECLTAILENAKNCMLALCKDWRKHIDTNTVKAVKFVNRAVR